MESSHNDSGNFGKCIHTYKSTAYVITINLGIQEINHD
jgi:hypothetical protein